MQQRMAPVAPWIVAGLIAVLAVAVALGLVAWAAQPAAAASRPAADSQPAGAAPLPAVSLTQVTDGLTLPVHVTHAGDGTGRLFVVEQTGRIRIVDGGVLQATPFLDISDRITYSAACAECGLLGLAFPPDYESSGYFVVGYTTAENVAPPDIPGDDNDTVIARFRVSTANPNVADAAGEERLLLVHQPYRNHNNGMLLFGPDGKLYAGLGDGGSGGDPLDNAQRRDTLLGKILRLNVGPGGPYTVPGDNPFVGETGARDEIWAYGLRNPWRFSFDRNTGDFWVADVGQARYEEVNFRPAPVAGGENFGWKILEGTHCYPADPCDKDGLVLPVHEYGRTVGQSVTGGYAYRGPGSRLLQGVYVYGDFVSGRIWALQRDGAAWVNTELLDTSYNISAFGEDEAGALYALDRRGGRLLRLDAAGSHILFLPAVSAAGAFE